METMDKYAFIMRGIPGSGKSTVAKMVAEGCFPGLVIGSSTLGPEKEWRDSYAIHSTDNLCMVDGEYQFDPELAGERHAQNLQNFKDSLGAGVKCVIVDNTNVKVEHFHSYVKAAEDAGYRVVFVELPHPAPCVAAARNTHNVPPAVINQMVMDWEPSQHCVTVAKVLHMSKIVRSLQNMSKRVLLLGAAVGGFIGFCMGVILSG